MSDMRRLIDIVSENRWADIGFSVRSDHLWPVALMESKDAEQIDNFDQWLDQQRNAQKIPSENSPCILAMILPSREEVYIMWGQATYIGQNQTHYQLQIQSGIHEYSKRNQIVFDSKESFEKFVIALRLKYEDGNRKIELKQMSVMETSRQVNDQSKLYEINFSSSVGNLSISNTDLISSSEIDGTIGSRKVYLFKQGKNRIYFFKDEDKIDALVYLLDDRVLAMKNFSRNRGLIYNLFQYIVNIKRQRVRLSSTDKLTHDGIKWIIGQINRSTGFRITDGNGNKINSHSLYSEWENSRLSGESGPTEIFISETKNSKSIRENESRLMPMDIFGSTLTESNEYTIEMPIMETSSVKENSDQESSDDSVDDITREFVSHYSEDPMGMFMHCKSSYLDAISSAKNFSMNAVNLHRSHVNMSKQEFQDSIMKHFVPHLRKHNFPKHASDDWGAAEQDFLKSLMSDDLSEACWKGYHREGNKKMFGKTYPNCVKNTNEEVKDVAKSTTHKNVPLIFKTLNLKNSQIAEYTKKYFECHNIDQSPGKFISNIKRFSKINESIESTDIVPFINMLQRIDSKKKIKIGDKFAVLEFEIIFAYKEINGRGFITPKEVEEIKLHNDGKINYIKFTDGDRYPRLIPARYEGKPITYAAYFTNKNYAQQALSAIVLTIPDEWDLDISDIDRENLAEGSGQEPGEFEIYDLRTNQRVYHPFEADDIMDAQIKADDWLEAIGRSGRGLIVRPVKKGVTEAKTPEEFIAQLKSLDKKPPRITNTCEKCGKKWQLQHHCKGAPNKDAPKESLNELAPSPGWDDDSGEIPTLREIAEIIHSYIGDKFTVERMRDHRGRFNPDQPGYKFIPKDPSKYGMTKIWCRGDRRGGEYPTYNIILYSYYREPSGRVIASGQHVERAVRKTRSNAYRTAELILNHTAGALKSDINESETTPQGMEVWQLGRLLGTTTGRTDSENPNRIEIRIRDSDRRTWIDRDWVRLRKPSQNS